MKTTHTVGWLTIGVFAAALALGSACGSGDSNGLGNTGGASAGSTGAKGSGTGSGQSGSGGGLIVTVSTGQGGGPTCDGATTCEKSKASCGLIGDGCGGILDCGKCTVDGETCGGGGVGNQCGKGASKCVPKSCADYNANCGPIGDGCGDVLDCGTCLKQGDSCGGGGKPSQCGQGKKCTPLSCADQGANCGPVGDGCGNVLDCGGCMNGETCGGGGFSSKCGAPPCQPLTCAGAGANCGAVADGCGGLLQCGTCSLPNVCGGGAKGNVCAIPASCTGLCLQQVSCMNGTTTISGRVFAPGHAADPAFPAVGSADPLPNALVFVPNASIKPFTPGVSCDNCGASVSGAPLVKAVSAIDGTFTLKNAPVGKNIPLVVQIGRWRRQVTIPTITACVDNAQPAGLTRLPRNKAEGDIPLMAFSTGAVDGLECVLRKMGVDDAEFTQPNGGGRIHIYTGEGAAGANAGGGTPSATTLWANAATIDQYDLVLFPCQGNQFNKTAAQQQVVHDYANAGGRVFATHYSYVWLFNDAQFSATANWAVGQGAPADQTGFVDQTFPKGLALAQWLQFIKASATQGQIPLQVIRKDQNGVIAPTQQWLTINNPANSVTHMTFNTPVGAMAQNQCGRVVFSDFHVENAGNNGPFTFPAECPAGAMTPQEKLLEFMLFDLSSCVTPDIPTCTAQTCAQLGVECGPAGDGCGNVIQCGTCPMGQVCGGAGPSKCGPPQCTAKTCGQLGIQCGPAGDGCGGLLQCGSCPMGQQCGGGGKPGVCGNNGCTPQTCAQQGFNCGPAGDGCGGLIQCGTCPMGQSCGAGGKPGVCAPVCTPKTCAEQGFDCGPAADGCGNIIQCGTCTAPATCGGGGKANVCGGAQAG